LTPEQLDTGGLSPRAIGVLQSLFATHPELNARGSLLAALWQNPQLFMMEMNCGGMTHAELCLWIGFPYEAIRRYGWHRYRKVTQAQQLLRGLGFLVLPPDALPPEFQD